MMQKRDFEENEYTRGNVPNDCFPLPDRVVVRQSANHLSPATSTLELMAPSLADLLTYARSSDAGVAALLEQQQHQVQLNRAMAAQDMVWRQTHERLLAQQHQRQVYDRLLRDTLLRQTATTMTHPALGHAMEERIRLERLLSTGLSARDLPFGTCDPRDLAELHGSHHVRQALLEAQVLQAERQRRLSANSDNEKQSSSSKEIEENEEEDPSIHSTDANEKFPLKLYRMLEEAEENGDDNIVSFLPHGKAFIIHKPDEFVLNIMPKYFSATRMSSFQRQLNLYGFRRITEGSDQGGYFHDVFIKGRKGLCKKIRRKRTTAKMPPPVAAGAASAAGRDMSSSSQHHLMYSPTFSRGLNGSYDSELQRLAAMLKDAPQGRGRHW